MEVFVCLLLACFLCPAVCALEVDGAEGGSVTFHLQDLKGENLGWSFNGEIMLTITLGESLKPSFFDNSYKSRVTIPDDGSSLTISQLGKKDAGTYTAKNPVYRANFTLRVHSVLQEPEVTCVSWNCSADGCRYVLRCAVHTPEITSFSWSHGEQLDAEEPELVVEEEQRPGELDVLSYTCTVQNPVSSRNVTVSPCHRLHRKRNPICCHRQQKLYRRHSRDGDHSADNPGCPLGLLDIPRQEDLQPPHARSSRYRKESGAVRTAPKHERDFGDNLKAAAEGVQRSETAPLQHRAQPERLLPACAAPKSCCLDSLGLGGFGGRVAAEYMTVYAEVGIAQQDFPRAQQNDRKKTPAPEVETSKTIYSTVQNMAQGPALLSKPEGLL
nr:uncharacterized protein LOC119713733 [Anas platyrhynchos]